MRVQVPLFTLMCVALTCAPAAAQEAEALRKEIEQLQKQLKALGDRLQRLESQPPPAAPALQPAPPTYPGISPIDLARPRQPFSLYQQRGAGHLLFDIGIDGDNETAFGRGTLRVPLFTGRLRTFLELGDANAVQLGMSVASGETAEKRRDTLLGWEGRDRKSVV